MSHCGREGKMLDCIFENKENSKLSFLRENFWDVYGINKFSRGECFERSKKINVYAWTFQIT